MYFRSEDQPDFWLDSGNIHLEQENYQEAISYYKKALEINPNHTYAWNISRAHNRKAKNKRNYLSFVDASNIAVYIIQ